MLRDYFLQVNNVEADDDETQHDFLPSIHDDAIDTGGITIPADQEHC